MEKCRDARERPKSFLISVVSFTTFFLFLLRYAGKL